MKPTKGFTLVELLVVIGIVAILVASAVFAFSQLTQRGRDARRRSDVQAVAQALDQYYLINGQQFPLNSDCAGVEAHLAAGAVPRDPFEAANPTYSYDLTGSCDSTPQGSEYCVCALMEVVGSGNAYGRTGSSCTWQGGASLDYFCISSKQ